MARGLGAQRANPVYRACYQHLTGRQIDMFRHTEAQTMIAAANLRHLHAVINTVRWELLDKATVTIECEAHDRSEAAESVRSIIRRNAEFVAHIGVREVDIMSISAVG